MDAFRITATAVEDEVTDAMVDEQTVNGGVAAQLLASASLNARRISRVGSKHALQVMLLGMDGDDDDRDEITSDDSGDFSTLTNGLDDAASYDLVRAFIAFDKQQERDIEALLRECEQLEREQDALWRRALTAEHAKRRSDRQHRRRLYGQGGGDTAGSSRSAASSSAAPEGEDGDAYTTAWWCSLAHAHDEVIDEVLDEFEDVWLNTARSCRYRDPNSDYHRTHRFLYAEPDHAGDVAAVFDDGFLYRIIAPEEAWAFYNDSHRYIMKVKYRFGSTSTVAAGPHAVMRQLPGGEVEAEVEVAPEETQILLFGEVNGFRNLSVAAPVTPDFTNTRVEARNAVIAKALRALALKAQVCSVQHLSPEDALRVCREDGGKALPFIDPDFPPCSNSIYRHGVDRLFLWSEPWRRPGDCMAAADAEEVRLFRGQVLPHDPCPGSGGDVYLCSAAAILAEYPMLVRSLFRYPMQRLTAEGGAVAEATDKKLLLWKRAADEARAERRAHAYRVTVNHCGWWSPTLLDDYLPASTKGPAFGRCEDDLRKLWYPLLQKAYAKAHGSYAAIQCGDVAEALQDFTGCPTSRFDDEWAAATDPSTTTETDRADLFEYLRSQQQDKGYAVCLSLPDEGPPNGRAPAMGLVYGMSYYVLSMVEHRSFDTGQVYRLVQLRCPSVKPGWDGMWCPESTRWKDEDRALAKLCGGDQGIRAGVWLDWASEVLPMFEGGAVCHLRLDMHDYRVRGEFHHGVPSVALEVEVTGCDSVEMYCTLSQTDDRCGDPDSPLFALCPLMLCVSKPAPLSPAPSQGASCSPSHGNGDGPSGSSVDATVGINAEALRVPAKRKHMVDSVCSTNPDKPSAQLSFIVGRDVALRYVFTPQPHEDRQGNGQGEPAAGSRYVYYVFPRARGSMQGKVFTLGLLSSVPVDNESVKVRFVQPSEHCEAFRNGREFTPEFMSAPLASANYQFRDHMGVVTSTWGSRIEPL